VNYHRGNYESLALRPGFQPALQEPHRTVADHLPQRGPHRQRQAASRRNKRAVNWLTLGFRFTAAGAAASLATNLTLKSLSGLEDSSKTF
jgi:hypothetical protein